jgi:hypothetical protein
MESDEILYRCPQCGEKACVVCLPDQGEAPCRNCEPTDPEGTPDTGGVDSDDDGDIDLDEDDGFVDEDEEEEDD